MSRFAYTPLVPALIRDGWVDVPQAGFLGGANCTGYVVSCLIAIFFPRRCGIQSVMRMGLVFALLGVLMSSFNFGFSWLVAARFIAGLSAAPLVVLTPSVLASQLPEKLQKIGAGLAFSGAGLFTLFVSLTLPFVLTKDVQIGWFYEALLIAVASLAVWPLTSRASEQPLPAPPQSARFTGNQNKVLMGLGVAYACGAIGMQPPTLFMTDYLHRDLGVAIAEASQIFSFLGLGFAVGAGSSGLLVTQFGSRATLLTMFSSGIASLILVLITKQIVLMAVAAGLSGFFVLGMVSATSQRTMECVGPEQHPRVWGNLSLIFAFGLSVGSLGMSAFLKRGATYTNLFEIATVALGVGLVVTVVLSCKQLVSDSSSAKTIKGNR
ncbi:YbfB/YjiJ family MFS transporter [Synechococcus sp. Cu2B8-bc1011]|uniref:YbfB/YjiJ family MFS transporter n=1 Tax=Synechococcus sp. Cu2B8-bc1011 TaxID=3093725 RepID=UPI0039AEE919